jgi:hypothetical protein
LAPILVPRYFTIRSKIWPKSELRAIRASYGNDPLPTPAGAMAEPFAAFPSWFLKVTCDRCFKDRMLNEVHAPERQRDMPLRVLLSRMRHDGCGGRAARAELLTGIDGVSSQPVRRIVLLGG